MQSIGAAGSSHALHTHGPARSFMSAALVSMGYQCSLGVLAAGHYGAPQVGAALLPWPLGGC